MKEFKVGQVWRARDNKLYVIDSIDTSDTLHFPIVLKPFMRDVIAVTSEGKYYEGDYESEYDLLEVIGTV